MSDGIDVSETPWKGWVMLELLGHRELAGHATEVDLFGVKWLRLDMPGDPEFTQFYRPGSMYCMTPTTEETARRVAGLARFAPVRRWELPVLPSGDPGDDDEEGPF